MTYKELLKSIYKEKAKYKKMHETNDMKFLIGFLEQFPTNDIDTWCKARISHIAILNILANGYNELIRMRYINILDYLSTDNIDDLMSLKDLNIYENMDTIKKIYNAVCRYNSSLVNIKTMNNNLETIKTSFPYNFEDFVTFIEDIKKYGDYLDFFLLYNIVKIQKKYDEKKAKYNNMIKPSIIKKVMLEEFYFIDELEKRMEKVYEYARKTTNGLTNKEINKTINAYNNLIDKIKNENKKEEIKDIDGLLSNYISDNLKNDILHYVYEHNNIYYEELSKVYKNKKSNSLLEYIAYFKSIGIDFNKLKLDIKQGIMKDDLDTIKEKMKYVTRFAYIDDYSIVIINNTIEELVFINNYVKKEYLNNDFIKENINMLIDNKIKTNVINNIKICINNKINIKKYIDKTFLLTDTSILEDNIFLLRRLEIPLEKCSDLNLLKQPLQIKIDLFIEVGLYEYMINYPDILNVDIDLAKRIILTKEVESDYIEEGKIKDIILNPEMFFIPSKKINSYVLDRIHNNYKSTSTITLPNEIKNHSYEIDGIIIPLDRVKTNPARLEDIIRPSLYTEEEINILEKHK